MCLPSKVFGNFFFFYFSLIIATEWKKPTLILYSDQSLVPFIQSGDFVVGNRQSFFKQLIPHAKITPRIAGGHVIQYDNPQAVSGYILHFLEGIVS